MTRAQTLLILIVLAATSLVLAGCPGGGGGTTVAGPSGSQDTPVVVEVKAEGRDGTVKLAIGDENRMQQLQGFVGSTRSRVVIESPVNDGLVRSRRVGVAVRVTDFSLGADAPGQHVRLVLDGKHQLIHTDPSRLAYFEDVPDGWHILSAMLCRENRMALKSESSMHSIAFFLQAGEVAPPTLDGPVLIYSLPAGDYSKEKGEAKAILIDFRVENVKLGPGQHTVRATLNRGQKQWTFTSIDPKVIVENLPLGTHTVKLELIDPQGKVVDCPVTPAEGTFRIVD